MTNERVCANTPALSRRTLLAALPASILVPVSAASLPGTASVEDDTPILRLFCQWDAEREAAYKLTEEECDAAVNRMGVLEEKILSLPSTCPADMAAKVASSTSFGDFCLPEPDCKDGRALWGEIESLLPLSGTAKVLPLGGAALASPAMSSVEDDTPILRVFREWRAYFEWAEGPATDGIDDDAFNEVCAKRREIEERMFALPCQNPIDVLAKLMAFTFNGADFADDDGSWSAGILAEAKSAVDGVLA